MTHENQNEKPVVVMDPSAWRAISARLFNPNTRKYLYYTDVVLTALLQENFTLALPAAVAWETTGYENGEYTKPELLGLRHPDRHLFFEARAFINMASHFSAEGVLERNGSLPGMEFHKSIHCNFETAHMLNNQAGAIACIAHIENIPKGKHVSFVSNDMANRDLFHANAQHFSASCSFVSVHSFILGLINDPAVKKELGLRHDWGNEHVMKDFYLYSMRGKELPEGWNNFHNLLEAFPCINEPANPDFLEEKKLCPGSPSYTITFVQAVSSGLDLMEGAVTR